MDLYRFVLSILICLVFMALQKLLAWRSYIIPSVPVASNYNPIFGNFFGIINAINNSSFLQYSNENVEKNGFTQFQIVLTGMAVLNSCDPEHLAHIFSKDHFEKFEKGEEFQTNFKETLGHGIFAVDGKEWSEKRKVSSLLFSSNSLRYLMSGVFLRNTFKVLEILTQIAENSSFTSPALSVPSTNHMVDIQDLFTRCTFDSICTIAFGMKVNSIGGSTKDVEFQRSYDIAQSIGSVRFTDPFWKVKKFFGLGLEKSMGPHIARLNEYIYDIIDQRLKEMEEGGVDCGDMLSLYIRHGKKKQKTFDRQYLRDMVLNFIIAGRDTTAAASMWIIFELAQNPEVETKLLEEIKEKLGEGEENVAPMFDIFSSRMPYLRSVIYESLRLHPSVPLDRKFANCDTFLEPGHIPIKKGQAIDYNIYMFNRNPKIWGTDAHIFRPERWLKEGKFVRRSEKEYPVFNLKPRGCLGRRMAELEAGMLVVGLLPKLKFEVVKEERKFQTGPILLLKGGMRMKVFKRED